jgi:membrane-bound hydrogenase subunit alpha
MKYTYQEIEKLSENLTYNKICFLVERICGLCSTSHPLAFCMAIENLCNISITEKAKYIRTILAELERVNSHLLWLGLISNCIGYDSFWSQSWQCREPILETMETISGNRQNYSMIKPGGVNKDIEPSAIPHIIKTLDILPKKIEKLYKSLSRNPIIKLRTKNIGILTQENCLNLGIVGPTARASGINIDIRKNEPYAAYETCNWQVIVKKNQDILDKILVRLLECLESINICKQCLKLLENEKSALSIQIKQIPEGEGIGKVEAPCGEVSHYICSNGSNKPVAHKIKVPSLSNIPAYSKTVIGHSTEDAALILTTIDPCYSCTERMAALEPSNIFLTKTTTGINK